MGQEKLKSGSSKGNTQQPRTNTPVEGARPRLAGTKPMEVDTPEVLVTSCRSSAGAAVRTKTKMASTFQARAQSTGPRQRMGPKAKQCATDQQGVRAMVKNVMERHGVSQEDWEQSQGPNYRVDPLNPPTWVVRYPPGQHLATLEGAPVDEWRPEPNITVD